MYIGIPSFDDDVAIKTDRCTSNNALFLSEKFTSITIFAQVGLYGSNWASVGALGDVAVMFASLTRIDVPSGKEPQKTSAPSVPVKFSIEMDSMPGPPAS